MSVNDGIVEIDTEQQLTAIIQKLTCLPDQIAAPDILKNALNDTTRHIRRIMDKRAKKRYAVSDSSVFKDKEMGAPQIQTADASDLTATLLSRGPMLDLMKFVTNPNGENAAAAAKVINENSMKGLEMNGLKAFITTFASGHTAIVQRHPPDTYTSRGQTKRLAAHAQKGRNWPPDMTKIKKLLGPAVPHMMGYALNMSQEEIERTVYDMLLEHVQKRIDKVTAAH